LKRLIDEDRAPGSPEYLLAWLVRASPRFERASFEKERILARVRVAAADPIGRVGAVASAVLVLSLAAVATAALASRPVAVASSDPPSADSPATSFVSSLAPPAASAPAFNHPAPPRAMADNSTTSVTTRAPREAPGSQLGRLVESHHPDVEDPTPVLEAIRALRSSGDAARASALLSAYLRAYPGSVLSEDALALSIEAAVARHDPRSAAELERRYLARFPNGRYKSFASQTVRASQP
jgi:hypothetical protein